MKVTLLHHTPLLLSYLPSRGENLRIQSICAIKEDRIPARPRPSVVPRPCPSLPSIPIPIAALSAFQRGRRGGQKGGKRGPFVCAPFPPFLPFLHLPSINSKDGQDRGEAPGDPYLPVFQATLGKGFNLRVEVLDVENEPLWMHHLSLLSPASAFIQSSGLFLHEGI